MHIISFILASLSYIISFVFYKKGAANRGLCFLITGLIFHFLSIISRGLLTGYPPFFGLYEILIFFSWSIVFVSLITGFYKVNGRFISLSVIIILGIVCLLNPGITDLPSEFRTVLFPIHVSVSLLGYSAFFVSLICAITYLINYKVEYDIILQKSVIFGFGFFTVGIITGSIWANQAWGSYWSWDAKETAALVTWIIYAIWLFTRFVFGWRGKRSAWLSIAGFCAVIFTWFGVNTFMSSLHSHR